MPSLKDLKNRISSVKSTRKITKAMQMVAAAKLRRAQERIFATRPYAYKLGEVIAHLQDVVDPGQHPLFAARPVSKALVIVVTGDRGLAGPFNANAIKTWDDFIAAGDLLNWVLSRRGENRTIHFEDANRLVALFFGAMGINEHARVRIRQV